jgi:hypothetical protein
VRRRPEDSSAASTGAALIGADSIGAALAETAAAQVPHQHPVAFAQCFSVAARVHDQRATAWRRDVGHRRLTTAWRRGLIG